MPTMPTVQHAQRQRRLADLQAAGDYAGLSKYTIRRRIADGTLTGYRLGRAIRVDLNELDAALRPIPSARAVVG